MSLGPDLGQISGGLNGLNSLANSGDALERGDEIAALNSGAILLNTTYIQFCKSAVEAEPRHPKLTCRFSLRSNRRKIGKIRIK